MHSTIDGCSDKQLTTSPDAAAQALHELIASIEFEGTVEYTAEAFPRFNHGLPHILLMEERAQAIQAAKEFEKDYADDFANLLLAIEGFKLHYFRRWLEAADALLAVGLKPSKFLGGNPDQDISVGA